ncbi:MULTISPECIES: phosphate ABC transporter permease subunit PstC [Glutamicibacter]|uniref:Phosphate transport system permease protein n=1 Tax=Glutamicibacter halophytocola TaxID=1933880 RepID=A0A5B8IMW5_9MICC|nr:MULTISPECIES: phosphate ABC transporter permease subunit PstC [Glutamicibacter]ALG27652.1 phosphate ABC transporter permease [Glutamicibacter halophytocola]MBF6673507.1 phosphate ABC transporter permease subunit PstC [Glutamicibacter sp. FBE19]NQD40255.1 phosphate ABC transporter permease subunit PstC [Glutamicibacter halophytocola]QDY67034.1 phosphate ABC transporter permease subunit PstC [Glutamicibacter halophytocola]UUX59188.1 phosphate ABC transporter permease subunit PstC [Glutamiciba
MTTNALTSKSSTSGRAGDKIFSGAALAAGVLILITLFAVAVFLLIQALPTFFADPAEISGGQGFFAYIWPIVIGTVIAAAIALAVATPIGLGVALFISHFAPRKVAGPLGYLIDLLAAIPSVIYGAWGYMVLAPALVPGFEWLSKNLGFIPLFEGPASQTGKTMLTAGIVLAVMVLPIITSLSREIFLQTPKLHEEAALALGATRWEMITTAVIPFARPGIISAVMLGLGRALGETMAVALVLSTGNLIPSLIKTGNQTIAAEIALNFPEAFGLRLSELIAAGLVLFLITLIVNMIARGIIARHKEFSGAN